MKRTKDQKRYEATFTKDGVKYQTKWCNNLKTLHRWMRDQLTICNSPRLAIIFDWDAEKSVYEENLKE